jgi:hypothetical protein
MEEVISQAPEHISKEYIETIFKKNNENVIDTLIELWDIEAPKDTTNSNPEEIDLTTPENKWTNIRDVCDSYDLEMQAHMNNIKSKAMI